MIEQDSPHVFRRKVRDQSIALLIVGAVLLMPPVAGISLIDGDIGGIPIPLLYVFVVWLALIVGAAAQSRLLQAADDAMPVADDVAEPDA